MLYRFVRFYGIDKFLRYNGILLLRLRRRYSISTRRFAALLQDYCRRKCTRQVFLLNYIKFRYVCQDNALN